MGIDFHRGPSSQKPPGGRIMLECAYCERPLACDACGADFQPANPDEYGALSRAEQPIACPACGQILVCKWCKTPYDGQTENEEVATD
jgi:uncharacterized CHY-type Zn-finger protein